MNDFENGYKKEKVSLKSGQKLSPSQADPTKLYAGDLESTIYHMILNEIPSIEYIKGARLWASKEIIKSIKQLYNGRPKVMDFVEHFDKFLDQVEQSQSGKGLKSLHIESCGWRQLFDPSIRQSECGRLG